MRSRGSSSLGAKKSNQLERKSTISDATPEVLTSRRFEEVFSGRASSKEVSRNCLVFGGSTSIFSSLKSRGFADTSTVRPPHFPKRVDAYSTVLYLNRQCSAMRRHPIFADIGTASVFETCAYSLLSERHLISLVILSKFHKPAWKLN